MMNNSKKVQIRGCQFLPNSSKSRIKRNQINQQELNKFNEIIDRK